MSGELDAPPRPHDPCDGDWCAWTCYLESVGGHGWAFSRHVAYHVPDAGTVDGEAPCDCEHHAEVDDADDPT